MKNKLKSFIICCTILLSSCATYELQVNEKTAVPFSRDQKELSHSFYLIGDAGYLKKNTDKNEVLQALNLRLQKEEKNSSILFLGDNVYPNGLPGKSDPNRKAAIKILDSQIESLTNFKGNTIFIPGNHDWAGYGVKGVKNQQKYIESKLGKNSYYPKNGCPIEKIDINEDVVLLAIDSQWYLENWDLHPTINDDCEIKTRIKFFDELEGLIKKNRDKTTLIAMHHPVFSNGPHGGKYAIKQHLFPLGNGIPLPVLGTLVTTIRETGGVSPQDIQNKHYQIFRKRVITLAQESSKVVFVSGHEHSLQFIRQDNLPQIISGSASKNSATKNTGKGVFSYGGKGYAKFSVYNDGSSEVSYFAVKNGIEKMIFNTKVLRSEEKIQKKNYPQSQKQEQIASVYSKEETDKSSFYKFIWGDRYRKYYSSHVSAPTVSLDTLFGGLEPIRKGGGHQSKSLRLKDKNGAEYVMRALRKSALKYLQAVAFKDKYIEGEFDNTVAQSQLLDVFTGAHPYAPFTIGTLSDAVGVYHTNPVLYYVPKQNALKGFNEDFGDELYMIEERAASNHGEVKSFGFSNKLISTDDMLKKIRKNNKHFIDEESYIKARLFDMLIGDWDRHEDQWRWAAFKQDEGAIVYRPVPRDRDQAFSIMADGALLTIATRIVPSLRLMQSYEEELRSPKWFNLEPYPLDVALITKSNKDIWDKQVAYIQNNLTDVEIEKAFEFIPKEINDNTIEEIKRKLRGRRSNLQNISDTYFKHINKYVVIKGTDKKDYFTIRALPNKQTEITVHEIINNEKATLIHKRIYTREISKEIWVYGLDNEDVFEVIGKQSILLRIIGGQNNDTYRIENGKKIHIYDYKSKKNTFDQALKATIHAQNKYDINTYDYKKLKYSTNQFIPSIAANPDDGFSFGFVNTLTNYGFNRNPFSAQHQLQANYYFGTSGFNVGYTGEFANIIGNTNLLIEANLTDSNYANNFFGFGNETVFEDDKDLDFYRVRQSSHSGALGIVYRGRQGAFMFVKGVYESFELEDTADRILTSNQDVLVDDDELLNLFDKTNFAGLEASYSYENYNDKAVPTLGMHFELISGYKFNVDNPDQSVTYLKPLFGIIKNISKDHRLVLATRLGSHINLGSQNDIEIYQSARLGRENGLRGFNSERFSGKHSFYSSSDVRYSFKKLRSSIVPLSIGFYGGFDVGRVWFHEENSKKWHNAVGGGVYMTAAQLFTSRIGVFTSSDGALISFGLGIGI